MLNGFTLKSFLNLIICLFLEVLLGAFYRSFLKEEFRVSKYFFFSFRVINISGESSGLSLLKFYLYSGDKLFKKFAKVKSYT